MPAAPEESPNFFDERFDFEEPFDLLESSESRGARGGEPQDERPTDGRAAPKTEATTATGTRRQSGANRRRRGPSLPRPSADVRPDRRSKTWIKASEWPEPREPNDSVTTGAEPSESGEAREGRRPRHRRSRRGRDRRETGRTPAGAARRLAAAPSRPNRPHADEPCDADVLEADVRRA